MRFLRFSGLILLVLSLSTVGMPQAAAGAAPPPPQQASWIAFEDGRGPAGPTLHVVASDASRVDLAAHLPGCAAAEVKVGAETYTRLDGEGFGHGSETGLPDLPVLRGNVEIPLGAQVSLELLQAEVAEYDLDELGIMHPIYPLQPPVPKLPDAQTGQPFELDAGFYHTDAFYPSSPVLASDEYVVRGHRVLVVEVWPLAYNPATGRVRVYSDVRLRLRLSGSDMGRSAALARRYASPVFERGVARGILNYNLGRANLYNLNRTAVGYLIITADAYHDSMLPFVTLKTAQGFQVTMTRLSEIPGGTSNSAIKSYIQNAYDTWPVPPSYVLLVGDTDTVPGWPSVSAAEITDLYYGTMDGTSDWVPDIGRGRFPVRSAAQATRMVDKAIAYANLSGNQTWLKKIAFIATCDNYTVAEGTHNYVINNYTLPEGYTGSFPNNPQAGGDRLYCISHNASSSNIQAALNDGRWAAIYSGHGSWTGWEMGFSSSNVQALTSLGIFPFVASHACISGDFDRTEVFGETWVLQENKGAIVFWGSSDSSFWGEDDVLERAAFDALFSASPQPSVAGMTDYGLGAVQSAYPGSARYYWETYNILGDPSLSMQVEAPDFTLDVTPAAQAVHPSQVATYAVAVGQVLGFAQPVSLNVTGLPAGSQARFDPASATPPFAATLTVTTTPSTPSGTYTLTVTGTGGPALNHTDQVQLAVAPWPVLSIAKTAPERVEVGTALRYTLTVQNSGGYATGVVVSDTLPAGAQVVWTSPGAVLSDDAIVWTEPLLPAGEALGVGYAISVGCVPSGTQIVNDGYRVYAADSPTPSFGLPVTTTAVAEGVQADFDFAPQPALTGWPVHFTNLSRNATAYTWALGDGNYASAAHPVHSYDQIGTYTVVLTASSSCASDVVSRPLTVEDYALRVAPAASTVAADSGSAALHTLWVTNTGTLSAGFQVAPGSHVWPVAVSPATFSLAPGEGQAVAVEVSVPASAPGGAEESVHVTATALSDPRTPPATAAALLTTQANTVYSVALGPVSSAQEAQPGTVVTYTLRVTNTGNVLDTISFARVGDGWPTELSRSSLTIARGGWRQIRVYVTVPATATGGTTDVASIRASGSGGAAESQLNTTAATVYGVALTPVVAMQETRPGQPITYTLQLTNTGNVQDVFHLAHTAAWAAQVTPAAAQLDPGSGTGVVVRVTPPLTATDGMSDTLRLTASGTGASSTSVLTILAKMSEHTVYLPLVFR